MIDHERKLRKRSGVTWLLLSLGLVAVAWFGYSIISQPADHPVRQALAVAAANTNQPAATPLPTQTATLEPTPTIGYQATAIVAQSAASTAQANADAAARLMVAATQQREQQIFVQQSWTATADAVRRQDSQATAQAASTYIPSTQTQQVFIIAAITTNQNISMTAQSMTITAPTQIVAFAQSQVAARMAPINAWISIFAVGSLGLFLISISIYFLRRPIAPRAIATEEKTAATIYEESAGVTVTLHSDDHHYPSGRRLVVPCTEEQLRALAQGLIEQRLTLAFKNWTGDGKPFTRDTSWPKMRSFMMEHRLVVSTGQGNLVLTGEGEAFFRGWLDVGTLPPQYVVTSNTGEIIEKNMHMRAPHARADGGGGGLQASSSANAGVRS